MGWLYFLLVFAFFGCSDDSNGIANNANGISNNANNTANNANGTANSANSSANSANNTANNANSTANNANSTANNANSTANNANSTANNANSTPNNSSNNAEPYGPEDGYTCPGEGKPSIEEGSRGWYRMVIEDAASKNALCNDGCDYSYYVRPGRGDDRNKWILFMKGGSNASSVEKMHDRWIKSQRWMKPESPQWRPSNEGLFLNDESTNPWASWTWVYIHYCSSDNFLGDREASAETGGWHIRGQSIVDAIMEDISNPRDPALPDFDDVEVLLGYGGSAGAQGMIQHVDRIASQVSDDVVVKHLADSGISPSVDLDLPVLGERITSEDKYAFWNVTRLDEDCVSAYADTPWVCLNTRLVFLQHQQTPSFFFRDQFDSQGIGVFQSQNICVPSQCDDQNSCMEGQCAQNQCVGPSCSDTTPCTEGFCHEAGACIPTQCSWPELEAGCPAGETCHQDMCAKTDSLPCRDDSQCSDGFSCSQGRCIRDDFDCENQACPREDEECVDDLFVCVLQTGCSSNNPCADGYTCLGKTSNPASQMYARGIRELLLKDLPDGFGGYSSKTGTHTAMMGCKAYALTLPDGQGNFLSPIRVFGNWFFDLPGPKVLVAAPGTNRRNANCD